MIGWAAIHPLIGGGSECKSYKQNSLYFCAVRYRQRFSASDLIRGGGEAERLIYSVWFCKHEAPVPLHFSSSNLHARQARLPKHDRLQPGDGSFRDDVCLI